MGPLDHVSSIDELPKFVKLGLYGTPGVGKTVFSASSPKPLFIDFERSTETLRKWPEYKDTPVITPAQFKDAEGLFRTIKDLPNREYETVILDTLSTAQNWQTRLHMAKVEKGSYPRDRHLPQFQDFRKSTEVFKEILAILQEMDINVVIIMHHREFWGEDSEGRTKLEAIRPDLTPRLHDGMRQLLNVVAFYQKVPSSLPNKVERRLYVNETPVIVAKNRFNIQDIYLKDPTWETLTVER